MERAAPRRARPIPLFPHLFFLLPPLVSFSSHLRPGTRPRSAASRDSASAPIVQGCGDFRYTTRVAVHVPSRRRLAGPDFLPRGRLSLGGRHHSRGAKSGSLKKQKARQAEAHPCAAKVLATANRELGYLDTAREMPKTRHPTRLTAVLLSSNCTARYSLKYFGWFLFLAGATGFVLGVSLARPCQKYQGRAVAYAPRAPVLAFTSVVPCHHYNCPSSHTLLAANSLPCQMPLVNTVGSVSGVHGRCGSLSPPSRPNMPCPMMSSHQRCAALVFPRRAGRG